jgi:DNA-binding XRE family transcriptional regulator
MPKKPYKFVCKVGDYINSEEEFICHLAKLIKVNRDTLSSYIKNDFTRLDVTVAGKICTYFNVPFGIMFDVVDRYGVSVSGGLESFKSIRGLSSEESDEEDGLITECDSDLDDYDGSF